MASETVTQASRIDVVDESADRIGECIAALDLASRAPQWNTEDFEALKRACRIVYRSLEEIEESLRAVGTQDASEEA